MLYLAFNPDLLNSELIQNDATLAAACALSIKALCL